ncbi:MULTISPECIES: SIS domain-containing protein [Dyella]|uniref:Tagatose-6-phosphate ketose isomerase n=2 Tax=Dyella TaxID=231454 RepID=A0A4R0YZT1_9GAMM|nr:MULTISPECIES: tagatose-6-phosphate ketose isomerase [Dyella]TBR39832.1 tagatose-6-phosphate ketose isomerase [Dyella terrae]TCI12588.1 tagatose-6-phosphate ketose isomerase [Dyella soli]
MTLSALRAASPQQQAEAGYADTLREILQQPSTWRATAALLRDPATRETLARALTPRPAHIVFTGSGSSMYIGECAAPAVRQGTGIATQAIAAGTLLTHASSVLPPGPGLLVSLARSGDSPESCGVVDRLLADAPDWRHLVITCNAKGKLATRYNHDPRVAVVVLDDRTNDRSLVMTSSFTNLLVACTGLLIGTSQEVSLAAIDALAASVERIFEQQADTLAAMAQRDVEAAVYLGSGGGIGEAHEVALKMVEMTGGKVITMAETYLGLRHGPMSSIRPTTLIVGVLSSDADVRGYELDLLRELARKQLGMGRLVIGERIPADALVAGDAAIELGDIHGGDVPVLLAGVVTGQLLALFRCLQLGDRPDAPSEGVLTRVVQTFTLHGADA